MLLCIKQHFIVVKLYFYPKIRGWFHGGPWFELIWSQKTLSSPSLKVIIYRTYSQPLHLILVNILSSVRFAFR